MTEDPHSDPTARPSGMEVTGACSGQPRISMSIGRACAMPACTRSRTGFTPRRVSPSPIRDGTLTQHRTDAGTPTG
ncbi:hypothetical protein CSOJ01_01492 [Colletotrichum sojae]|uniref:Uncharacterized protein n=1 Tax=Colletotrichum sojae TaxID=2175907 RepID=A0A8H6N3K6_9PEZI|nr:hypothetical protein CSOJ01_01492 [Colletotrichum sojae]